MRTGCHETRSTRGSTPWTTSMPLTLELRFALVQARERCPSTDDADIMTAHLDAMAIAPQVGLSPRLVILSPTRPDGAFDHGSLDAEDRADGCAIIGPNFNGPWRARKPDHGNDAGAAYSAAS
jgi:hypothetical protein